MHQAIPYRSWGPLHTPTTHFTPHPFITDSDNNNNNSSSNNNKKKKNNPSFSVSSKDPSAAEGTMVLNMVSENAVIVFGRRGCCMSHVVKRLLLSLGVNPAVYEVEEKDEEGVVRELEAIDGKQGNVQFPAVFIGGKMFGGLDRLMATHISGELVPMLKEAGALWL
ncbi:glutaredoxin-C9-like [Gastrolobium bilobum]|uniref:glutaredoxin-C9-like n=1 Tax=Gastrolobium bilobum TaxID=150636 RepID=UPI002AB1B9ED|nr:glutaredoxin-C9-like [Gastrolobium bilobum]